METKIITKKVSIPIPNDKIWNGSNLDCLFTVGGGVPSQFKQHSKTLSTDNPLEELLSYNDRMMEWLSKDSVNMQRFFDNPVSVFKEVTNAPESLLDRCRKINITQYGIKSPIASVPKVPAPLNDSLTSSTMIDYSQGWDFVAGICQKEANKALELVFKNKAIKFHETTSYSVWGKNINLEVEGEFGVPQIVGGNGSLFFIEIPISKGCITVKDFEITRDVSGGIFCFTTDLNSVESEAKSESGGTIYDYFINFTSAKSITNVELKNIVTIGTDDITEIERAILKAMNKAFYGNEYKLFSIDLKGYDKEYPYMVPSYVRYAFMKKDGNPDRNVIGVLVQTTGDSTGVIQMDSNTIPDMCDGAIILSNRLAVEGVLKQTLKSKYKIADNNFKVEGLPRVLSTEEPFDYPDKVKGHTVKIEKCKVWFENNQLKLELKAHVEPSAGINIDYTVEGSFNHRIETEKDKDGKDIQVIKFVKDDSDYKEIKEVTADWWVWLLGVITLFIGALIIAIVLIIIDAISPSLGGGVFKDALAKVKWNHMEMAEIKLLNVGGHLQIGTSLTCLH